jgi:non-homologous end joining protein Ku
MKLIKRKVESGGKTLPEKPDRPKAASNVVDLAAILQQSLEETGQGKATKGKKRSRAA